MTLPEVAPALLLLPLIVLSTIVVHELGHALMARLLGYKAECISIGHLGLFGQRDFEFKLLGLHFFSGWEEVGSVSFEPACSRKQLFWIALAGPMTNFAVAGLMLHLAQTHVALWPPWLLAAAVFVVLFNFYFVISSLLPRGGSDGAQALASLRGQIDDE